MILALAFAAGILVGAAGIARFIFWLDPWGPTISLESWERVKKASQDWRDNQRMNAR